MKSVIRRARGFLMGMEAKYKLTVHGEDASFNEAVGFLETPEAVLTKAAGEKWSLFGSTGMYQEVFDAKMIVASKKYPSLLFEVYGEFPDDGGDYTKTYFRDGKKASYQQIRTFPPFDPADLK
jgi:hypothetical protein